MFLCHVNNYRGQAHPRLTAWSDAASHNPQGKTPLSEYTPRELIMELKGRGYKGRLVWQPPMPQPIVINIEEFN